MSCWETSVLHTKGVEVGSGLTDAHTDKSGVGEQETQTQHSHKLYGTKKNRQILEVYLRDLTRRYSISKKKKNPAPSHHTQSCTVHATCKMMVMIRG